MMNPPLRILVVDDNQDSARMLEVLLKLEGHEACLAFDGLEAIEAVKLCKPDVVLLDLTLPEMSGLQVAEQLRHDPEHSRCKIVAVTGHGEECLPSNSPFDHHFQKPVDPATLLEYLSEIKATQTPVPCPSPDLDSGAGQSYRQKAPDRQR
jgi:CheY-like chemotaxis protein